MATRSVIRINGEAGVYRHWDGYPESVLQDIKATFDYYGVSENRTVNDAPYFAATFIFLAKLSMVLQYDKEWAGLGYGVVPPDYTQVDLEYEYIINGNHITIRRIPFDRMVFDGTIDEAVERFAEEEAGHINLAVLDEVAGSLAGW